MSRRVLVVGATGILGPAADALAARGDTVLGVSRRGGGPAGSRGIAVDAQDATALAVALEDLAWDDAVVYGRTVNESSLAFLRGATPGRLVFVRTSAAADPALGELTVPPDTLQLGWTDEGAAARWHTPAEVSEAALAVLADGEPRTLGTVRPWSDRP